MHISPRTVAFLRALGHDVVRVDEIMLAGSTDESVVAEAVASERAILTQDLRFSAILARADHGAPSLISLRLSSSRVEFVNALLARVLPIVSDEVRAGAIVTVEENRVRTRRLPIT
jgi:predicted nuclease of predicted toxin-antitoxin system